MKKVLSQMPSMQNGIPHSTLKSNSRHKVQPESFLLFLLQIQLQILRFENFPCFSVLTFVITQLLLMSIKS